MEAIIALIGGLGLVALLFLYDSFAWGYVFMKTYTWFVLPVFTFLPSVTFHEVIGICIFLTFFKNHNSTEYEGLKKKVNWGTFIAGPWVVLLVAYFIRAIIH